jgi:hypothetical protein
LSVFDIPEQTLDTAGVIDTVGLGIIEKLETADAVQTPLYPTTVKVLTVMDPVGAPAGEQTHGT